MTDHLKTILLAKQQKIKIEGKYNMDMQHTAMNMLPFHKPMFYSFVG
jgi:hypothetical protein